MPIRQEISCHLDARFIQPNPPLLLQPRVRALFVLWVLVFASTTLTFAQETPKPQVQTGTSPAGQQPPDQTPSDQPPSPASRVPGAAFYNLLQKKSIVFPDIAQSTERLTPGGKFELFVDNSISLHTITYSMLGAAIGQADNSPTGFGQGWDAYAKRFGATMGRQTSTEFFGTFVLASALHEDPRFYADANPSFSHAVKYSVLRLFITRNDDGRDVANISGLIGPAMSEGLANVYWPDRNRTVGDTFLRYGIDLATKAGGNMLREYWPVFSGKVHHAPRSSPGH